MCSSDLFNVMLSHGAKLRTRTIQTWIDAGTIESWLEANRLLLEKNSSREIPTTNSRIVLPVFIADGARIANSIIGPYASISANAVIENSTVRDSVVCEDAQVRGATLEQSVVGAGAIVRGVRGRVNVGSMSVVDVE